MTKLIIFKAEDRTYTDALPGTQVSEDRQAGIEHSSLVAGEMKIDKPFTASFSGHDAYFMLVDGAATIEIEGDQVADLAYSESIWLPRGSCATITPKGAARFLYSFTPGNYPSSLQATKPSSKAVVFTNPARRYEPRRGKGFVAWMCREVFRDSSTTLGAGIIVYDRIMMPWTPGYDSYYRVIEGEMQVRTEDALYHLAKGDSIWIPKGLPLSFESDQWASIAYALYPVDWELKKK